MSYTGLNLGYLIAQFFFCIPLLLWIILAVIAVSGLRRARLDETSRALWVLIVLLVPILGAVIYWWVRPGSVKGFQE